MGLGRCCGREADAAFIGTFDTRWSTLHLGCLGAAEMKLGIFLVSLPSLALGCVRRVFHLPPLMCATFEGLLVWLAYSSLWKGQPRCHRVAEYSGIPIHDAEKLSSVYDCWLEDMPKRARMLLQGLYSAGAGYHSGDH